MPNVKAFIEDPANASDVTKYTVREGVMYCLPVHTEQVVDPYIFLYRKDLFEKHDLQWPTNQEEFVAVLRKLKEEYPSSYPFVMRAINGNMQSIMGFSHLWGATHLNQGAYNTIFTLDENGEYYMAQVGENYKEMCQFLNELMNEGLMHPSCATMDAASLELGLKYVGKHPPQHRLRYNDEEQMVYDTYALSCFNHAQTQFGKFLLNQRDFSEWDKVLEELKTKYHYDELMEIHKSALARVKEEHGID